MTTQEIEKYFKRQKIVTPWAALDKTFDTLVAIPENHGRVTLVYAIDVPEDNYGSNIAGTAMGVYSSSLELGTAKTLNNKYRYTKTPEGLWVPEDEFSTWHTSWLDQFLEDAGDSGINLFGANITKATLGWLDSYVTSMVSKEPEKKVITYQLRISQEQIEDIVFNTVTDRLTTRPGDPGYREEMETLVEDFVETYGLHWSTIFNGDYEYYKDETSRFNATMDVLVKMIERRL